jgi:hypothetical protein
MSLLTTWIALNALLATSKWVNEHMASQVPHPVHFPLILGGGTNLLSSSNDSTNRRGLAANKFNGISLDFMPVFNEVLSSVLSSFLSFPSFNLKMLLVFLFGLSLSIIKRHFF